MNGCIIGEIVDYDSTRLVTLEELQDHIAQNVRMAEYSREIGSPIAWKVYSMADYCDRRRNTDLRRFLYCPMCGKLIPWKEIKNNKGEQL